MSANETESKTPSKRSRRRGRKNSIPAASVAASSPSRLRSAFGGLSLKNVCTLAFGVAIGTAPILAGMIYLDRGEKESESSSLASVTPTSAVEAVRDRLPQVAILGEKEAPAGMTEVFIQVPGVLNMQSVYVLADNKTVISGMLLPERSTASVVAGPQITMPTGMPTVDMGGASDAANPAQTAVSAQYTQSLSSSPVTQTIPTAPEQPPVAASAETVPVTSASAPVVNPLTPAINSEEFSAQIVSSIKNNEDPLITQVRNAKTDKDQQDAYWNAVTSIPSITQGNGKRQLYVFFDPNCPVCHQFYGDMQSKIAQYDLTINWIPVVIFTNRPSSVTVSATLLSQLKQSNELALATLQQIMLNPASIEQIHQQYTEDRNLELPQVVTNTSLMTLAKAGTPLLVYKDFSDNLAISLNLANEGQLAQIKSS